MTKFLKENKQNIKRWCMCTTNITSIYVLLELARMHLSIVPTLCIGYVLSCVFLFSFITLWRKSPLKLSFKEGVIWDFIYLTVIDAFSIKQYLIFIRSATQQTLVSSDFNCASMILLILILWMALYKVGKFQKIL